MKKRILSLLITLPILLGVSAYAVEEEEITVYMTVEKLTLGQGFIMEPTAIQTVQGVSVAEVLEQVMSGQYMHTGTIDDNLYVSAFADAEQDINIPYYISDVISEVTPRQDSEWLSEFDYSDTSGWKYSVNNEFLSVSSSDAYLQDGDVIRWQFSLYGYGADLGSGEEYGIEPLVPLADKSELIRYAADFGGSEYAMEVLTRFDSSPEEVEDALNFTDTADEGYSGANLKLSADYVLSAVAEPQIASIGGEWAVIGLARSGIDIDTSYFDGYYKRVADKVRECRGVLHERKYTEYARVVLALAAIGKDPTNVCGYNLVAPLTDFEAVMKQGLNGAAFALLAMDACDYKAEAARQAYIKEILSRQTNGAFALSKNGEVDIDITAMALCALSNYSENPEVQKAIEAAVEYMSAAQESDGGFTSLGGKNSESASQVITALTSLGISPDDDRFVKNGISVLDYLLSYGSADGSFRHEPSCDTNLMATEQALYALAAVERANGGNCSLYDMSDVKKEITVGPKRPVFADEAQKILDLAERL